MKVYELLATPDKWIQDHYHAANGRCCIIGAVNVCYDGEAVRYSIKTKIRAAIGGGSITEWNDAPSRTHAEVLALCKELDI